MTESEIQKALRPDCFEFAMSFLGDPEESIIRAYIEKFERDNGKLKQLCTDLARVLWQMQENGWINCGSGDEQDERDCDHWRAIAAGLVKKAQEELL